MPGLPVHHEILELAQTHVHGVSDAIQPSHSLLPSSPFAFNLSQQQGLSQRVSSLHQVARVLECQLQHQSTLKEISPEYSLEGLTSELKLEYFGHLMQRTDSLENTMILGKIEGRRRRG